MIDKDTRKEVHMLTLSCNNKECMTRLRIGRFIREPSVIRTTLDYCPACGGPAMAMSDVEENFMEALANQYGVPVEAMQMLYALWDSNKFHKFSDFYKDLQNEIAEDAKKAAV